MASTLELEITGVGVLGEGFDLTGSGETETFANTRNTNKKITIVTLAGVDNNASISQQVYNVYQAIYADYFVSGKYDDISYDETKVYLVHEDNDHFDSFSSTATNITQTTTLTDQKPTVTITQAYSEHTIGKCVRVLMTLNFTVSNGGTVGGLQISRFKGTTTTELYNDANHDSNTLVVDIPREGYIKTNAIFNVGIHNFNIGLQPPKNLLKITSVAIQESVFAAKVTIYINSFLGSDETQFAIAALNATPEYSNLNVFTGITPGDYRVYAKDKYGCEQSDVILVEEAKNVLDSQEIFVSIKNTNYFANRTVEGLTANINNFLPHDDPFPVKAENYLEVFAESQLLENQFKSNYPRHEACLKILCNEDVNGLSEDAPTVLEIIQRTDNISRNTFLDAVVADHPSFNAAVISFVPGNEYFPDGSVKQPHTYNEVLPDFYFVGMNVRISGFDGEIISIYEEGGIQYALTNIQSLTTFGTLIVESVHLALDHEVYEISEQASDYVGKICQFTIDTYKSKSASSPNNEFKSQPFKVIPDDEFTSGNWHVCEFFSINPDAEIDYTQWNKKDLGFTLGEDIIKKRIKHLKNIEFIKGLSPVGNADVVVENLDNSPVKTNVKNIRVFDMWCAQVPSLIAASYAKLFDESEFVSIDGLLYTSMSPVSLEGDNQYKTPKVQVGLLGSVNENNIKIQSINRFYPVVD